MRPSFHRNLERLERLEARICPAAFVSVVDGNLVVVGEALASLEVIGTGPETFAVFERGRLLASPAGVTGGIVIQSGTLFPTAGDSVAIDLGGNEVDFVFANLSDGQNTFEARNGTVQAGTGYLGGSDRDQVLISEDYAAGSAAAIALGDGMNSVDFFGRVDSLFTVIGGAGDEAIQIGPTAQISGWAGLFLGDGDNLVVHAGAIDHLFAVFGGAGQDTVDLQKGSVVGSDVYASLGDGQNRIDHRGTLGRHLTFVGGADVDVVNIASGALVRGSVDARMKAGSNHFIHAGKTRGDVGYEGGEEADEVQLMGRIDGDAKIGLGAGQNLFVHDGLIAGDLRVRATNPATVVNLTPNSMVLGRIAICLQINCEDELYRRADDWA